MVEEKKYKGVLKALGTKRLAKLYGKDKVDILPAKPKETCPYYLLSIPSTYGRDKSCLYNFPGSYDIGILSSVQDIAISKLVRIIGVAEEILKICEMSILVLTVNAGFSSEAKLLELGFTKEVTEGNPHSGNTIRFFIKEL